MIDTIATIRMPVAPEPGLKRGRRFLPAFVGGMEVQDGVEHILFALHDLVQTMEYMAFGKPVVAFDLAETRRTAQDAAR